MPDTSLSKMTSGHWTSNLIHREFDINKKNQYNLHYVFILPQNGPHIRHTVYSVFNTIYYLHGRMWFKDVNSSALEE